MVIKIVCNLLCYGGRSSVKFSLQVSMFALVFIVIGDLP